VNNRLMSEIVRRQKPVSMRPSATVQEACRVMRDAHIGAIVVTDDANRVLGILTGRDCVCRMLADGRDAATTTLAEVMTPRPDTMPPERHAIDALRLMGDGGFRHLPVVENGKLVGIVSRGDFRGLEQARLDEETGYWERI
jgi:CBS domain-containing protein